MTGDELPQADTRVACPKTSEVVFFTVDSTVMSQADIAALPCQQTGSCGDVLNQWIADADPVIQGDPVYRCEAGAYCDLDRRNLRAGKAFFSALASEPALVPFRGQLESAFRYKLRFQGRDGSSSVGFTPEIFMPSSKSLA